MIITQVVLVQGLLSALIILSHCLTVRIAMLLFKAEILTLLLRDRMAKQNVNSFITRNNFCISWNHPVSKKDFSNTNLSLNLFSCIDHIITTRNVFDSIREIFIIWDTWNMSNLNIVYMSIAFNNFTNVEICDIHTFNCAWKKQQWNISISINCN